ncbi:uncharacterized protein [Misgurnus anguillicaudatus]|uniref:uncharacterized protein n=1 Tax=Misgurnus anguillicaudatus TaxID=75329 RepID=UPI003CCFB35A
MTHLEVLQVRKHQNNITCYTSCRLTPKPQHIYWKKDGRYIVGSESKPFSLSSAAYSCFISPYFKISSDPLCLSNSACWGVAYTSTRVCALVGSTVDIHSSYSHPTGDTVEKTYWHLPNNNLLKYQDLRDVHQFAGRVEFVGNTLKIKNVKMIDSGEYRFRIITNTDSYSGSPGVILTVTDTQVISSPFTVSKRGKVILSCSTKCTLDNNITYSWYKNGRPVTDGVKLYNKLYLDSVNSEEIQEYSCAVGDESVEISASEHFYIFLIVFVVQIFIIAVIWVWFCLKKSRLKKQMKDKNEETPTSIMFSCTSAVPPTEPDYVN